MALKIRLARGGSKKRPYYRIVVAEAQSPRDGRFIEKVGRYNPILSAEHPERLVLDGERIQHWIKCGAQPSDRVARFLGEAKLVEAPKRTEQTKKSQPKKKAQERLAAEVAAQAEAEAAAKAAAEAPAPAEEPVIEAEVPAEAAPAESPAEETPAAEEA